MSDMVDPADDALIAHLAAFSVHHAGSRVTVSADSIRRALARLYMAEEARDTALTDKHDELAEAAARIAALEEALLDALPLVEEAEFLESHSYSYGSGGSEPSPAEWGISVGYQQTREAMPREQYLYEVEASPEQPRRRRWRRRVPDGREQDPRSRGRQAMTPEQDMENNAVLAERYAEIMAEKIERLIPHIHDGTHVTATAREAVNNAAYVAAAALERLRNAAIEARDARKPGKREARNERRAA